MNIFESFFKEVKAFEGAINKCHDICDRRIEKDKEFVGGEYILSVDEKGLTVKRNELGNGCSELFRWEDIKHLVESVTKHKTNRGSRIC